MHSSLIGKIEKANRYARETDRITFERLSVTFRGDNDTYRVSFDDGTWKCACHTFQALDSCAHILALQKILGVMLPDAAQTSLFASGRGVAEPQPA